MNNEALIESLKKIVKPYVKDEEGLEKLNPDSDFLKDLKINSANLVDVVLDIENEFDIIIDNESMERMLTVQSAMDIINNKLSQK